MYNDTVKKMYTHSAALEGYRGQRERERVIKDGEG